MLEQISCINSCRRVSLTQSSGYHEIIVWDVEVSNESSAGHVFASKPPFLADSGAAKQQVLVIQLGENLKPQVFIQIGHCLDKFAHLNSESCVGRQDYCHVSHDRCWLSEMRWSRWSADCSALMNENHNLRRLTMVKVSIRHNVKMYTMCLALMILEWSWYDLKSW